MFAGLTRYSRPLYAISQLVHIAHELGYGVEGYQFNSLMIVLINLPGRIKYIHLNNDWNANTSGWSGWCVLLCLSCVWPVDHLLICLPFIMFTAENCLVGNSNVILMTGAFAFRFEPLKTVSSRIFKGSCLVFVLVQSSTGLRVVLMRSAASLARVVRL